MFPKPSRARAELNRYAKRQERQRLKNRAKLVEKRAAMDAWDKLKLQVFQRDGGLDQSNGKRVYVQTACLPDQMTAHHIIRRSAQGPDELWNLVCVSYATHALIHDGFLDVEGNANKQLTWTAKDKHYNVTHVWTSEPVHPLAEVS